MILILMGIGILWNPLPLKTTQIALFYVTPSILVSYVIKTVANDTEGGSRMDNPETLATLDTQDT